MRAKRATIAHAERIDFSDWEKRLPSILSLPTCIVSVNKLILDHKVTPTHDISIKLVRDHEELSFRGGNFSSEQIT